MMRVLGLVVARSGSKGLPGKNVRDLGGRPLVAYAVRACVRAPSIATTVISTDSPEIAEVARSFGAEVPFLRPAGLATDEAPVLLAVEHALRSLEERARRFDAVCLVQPTTPFRSVDDIEAGIRLLGRHDEADSVVALARVEDGHPARLRRIADGRVVQFLSAGGDSELGRRQSHSDDVPYRRCGGFYLARRDVVLEKRSLYGDVALPYIMPPERSLSIDDEHDFLLAQAMLESRAFADRLAHVRRLFE